MMHSANSVVDDQGVENVVKDLRYTTATAAYRTTKKKDWTHI